MNTDYAKQLAIGRHHFLEEYLEQFYAEWDAKKWQIRYEKAENMISQLF